MKTKIARIKTSILALMALLAVCMAFTPVQAQSDINLSGYTLTFADEFNSVSVTTSNPKGASTWYYVPPYGASGAYSDSKWDAAAFSAAGGILTDKAWINTSDVGTRNNWSGWVGFKFTTGANAVVINSVGRWVISGNSQSHVVKLVDASNGVDVPNGSATVNTSGQPVGFVYANLTTAVTLSANHSYYLMSQETNGGDQNYDCGYPQITTTSAIKNPNAAYYDTSFHNLDWNTFGPVNLKSGSTPLVSSVTLGKWHSGNLSSMDPSGAGFAQLYGYFEIRCQMPNSGSGAWPAFWMNSRNGIPAVSDGLPTEEIDMFEWYGVCNTPGNLQNFVAQNTHNWNPTDNTLPHISAAQTPMPDGSYPWQGYHIYGVLVTPTNITMYIDGVQTNQCATPTSHMSAPFYIMIDYALGGGWPLYGMVNNSTFLVDWVRVYSLPTSGPATLTHQYTFNGNFNDSVGTANGTLNGSAAISGNALQLPGGNNGTAYGSLPTSIMSGLTSASFEGWFTESAIATWEKVFFPGNTNTTSFLGMTTSQGTNGMGRSDFLGAGGTQYATGGVAITPGTKYYFACVYDGAANTQSLYVAPVGGSIGAPLTASMGGKNVSNIVFNEFYIGRSPFSGDKDFAGSLDEIRIYNGALSSSQISANFAAGPTGGSGLPSPWVNTDIGSVGVAGSSSYSGGVFTIKGAGSDIWGTADSFQYAYQAASGDCSITARVASQTNTSNNAKACVMIRSDLTAGSAHAMMTIQPINVQFLYRLTAGASAQAATSTGTVPYWLRVTRVGNVFTGYKSSDGTTWTQVGTPQTITMGTNVYIGLPVCSHNTATLSTATFDNVTVTP
ncbi:MAG: family 16 glycosylhydrolase [Methylacidiphilales bacterium]|nr:family 16 glycosylhydrolase [Candidatus Methylacidiphilales bacterium]